MSMPFHARVCPSVAPSRSVHGTGTPVNLVHIRMVPSVLWNEGEGKVFKGS